MGLLANNYFGYVSSVIAFISYSFLKDIFAGIEFAVDSSSLPTLVKCITSFLSLWFLIEIWYNWNWPSPIHNLLVFSSCSQDFFFVFIFRSLIKMCVGMNFFGSVLFSFLTLWVYISCQFGEVSNYYFIGHFSALPSTLFLGLH